MTDRLTDRPTDRRPHREVPLPKIFYNTHLDKPKKLIAEYVACVTGRPRMKICEVVKEMVIKANLVMLI